MQILPLIYSLVYLIGLGNKNNRKSKTILYYSIGFILIVITIALDKTQFPDYYAYVSYFNSDFSLIEPSFILLRYIIHYLKGSEIWLFSFYAIIGIGLKFYIFKRLTTLLFFTVAIYIASYWPYHELIQIRAGVAAAILLISVIPLYEGKKEYFFFVLVAIFFHSSAVTFLPLWFIRRQLSHEKLIYMFIIPLSMILYTMHLDVMNILQHIPISYIQNKIVGYMNLSEEVAARGAVSAEEYNPFITWYMIKVLFCYILWFNCKKIHKHNKYYILLLKIYTIGLSLLWLFGGVPVIATRTSELLGVVQVILIPLLVYSSWPVICRYIIVYVYGIIWIIWNINSFFKEVL